MTGSDDAHGPADGADSAPEGYEQLDSSGSRYDASSGYAEGASGYDADEAWTVRKDSVGPGWTTQAGAGNGPGWGSTPTYASDATPSGTSYGESVRLEAEAVGAAESAPADPDAEPAVPDYSSPVVAEDSTDEVPAAGAAAQDPVPDGDAAGGDGDG